nr:hypothetical protein [Tanacetum cinerariifolium]
MENTMLELLEVCQQKELYCMHINVDDLNESALNSKLLSINLKSQRLNNEKQEVKNIVEQPTKHHYEILSNSNDDDTLSDDDDFETSNVILREKLLNINRLIANIEYLNDDPTPDHVLKSPSSFPIPVMDSDSFMNETDISFPYSDNSLLEFEIFSDHTEETRSGSTTSHANNSLPEYDSFRFEIEPDPEDNSIPPGIENIDYDSERDIHFLKELLSNDSLPLLENESSNFDHHDDPSFPRPLPEPPDVEMTITFPSYLSFEFFYLVLPTLRFLLYYSPPGVKTPFLTSTSPLKADGISSGWNFPVL